MPVEEETEQRLVIVLRQRFMQVFTLIFAGVTTAIGLGLIEAEGANLALYAAPVVWAIAAFLSFKVAVVFDRAESRVTRVLSWPFIVASVRSVPLNAVLGAEILSADGGETERLVLHTLDGVFSLDFGAATGSDPDALAAIQAWLDRDRGT
ncbi:MAG: hypothetical protein ACFBRM_14415 [Pikeienuella sp.]